MKKTKIWAKTGRETSRYCEVVIWWKKSLADEGEMAAITGIQVYFKRVPHLYHEKCGWKERMDFLLEGLIFYM